MYKMYHCAVGPFGPGVAKARDRRLLPRRCDSCLDWGEEESVSQVSLTEKKTAL